MSDSFNPQEILSRLRAKPNSSSSSAGNGNVGGASQNSTPIVTSNNASNNNNSNSNKDNASSSGAKPSKGALKTPQSLTLTATQVGSQVYSANFLTNT
jgi:hypothetical protein